MWLDGQELAVTRTGAVAASTDWFAAVVAVAGPNECIEGILSEVAHRRYRSINVGWDLVFVYRTVNGILVIVVIKGTEVLAMRVR